MVRIILTRAAEATGALESGLQEAGHQVLHLPLTQQMPVQGSGQITTALTDLSAGKFSWLLLTSGNTVRFLSRAGWDGSVPEQTRVGVVGPGTAQVLEGLTGISDPWMPREHSAAGIVAELPAPGTEKQLLLPQSAKARSVLSEGLIKRGWQVTQLSVYDTAPVEDPDMGTLEPGDVVLVTSSSAAEVWATLNTPEATVLAIGEPTAETLRSLGHPAASVLPEPTAGGILQALDRLKS